jgi:hypothetical protein
MAERRKIRKRRPIRLLVVAALSAFGLVVAVWAVIGEINRISEEPSSQPSVEAPVSPFVTPEPARTVPPSIQACIDAVMHGEVAVSRARASVGDWAAHIQAMTDLQSGKISEAAAKRIWAATTGRSKAGIAAFRTADAEYQQTGGACRATPEGDVTADAAAAVNTCRDIVAQTDAMLAAARRTVSDWAAHAKDIAERNAGRLDPHGAQRKWLSAYRKAPTNIEQFTAAERAYRGHARCTLPGG